MLQTKEEAKKQATIDLINGKKPKYTGVRCQDCGNWEGHETLCPYAQDIHNKEVEVTLCGNCYYQRSMEV